MGVVRLFGLGVVLASFVPKLASADYNFIGYLRDGEYEKLEAKLAEYERTRERNENGNLAVEGVLDDLASYMKEDPSIVPNLSAWERAYPTSYYPVYLQGKVFASDAYYARGTDYAEFVPKEAWQSFHEDMAHAREQFLRAHALAPKAAIPSTELLWIEMNEGTSSAAEWHWFEEATRFDPTNAEAHMRMLEALKPKWGGSNEAMFRFAREAIAKHPSDPNLQLLIAEAHQEMASHGTDGANRKKYLQQEEVWKEVRQAYERYLAAYPNAWYQRNWLAQLAYTVEDREVLRREMPKIKDKYTLKPWFGRYDLFERAQRMAEEEPSGKAAAPPAAIAQ
jgi:hypothetical protein